MTELTEQDRARSRTATAARLLAVVVSAALLGGCGQDTGPAGSPSQATVAASSTAAVAGPEASSTRTPLATVGTAATADSVTTGATVTKLLVVVVENHSLAQMRAAMPYTYSLALRYGYADHYTATTHPSLPNYLAIASGSTHGVTDDASPAAHHLSGPTVFGAALRRGRTAAVYADAMTTPCRTTPAGRYAVKHNPWAYFVDERALCDRHDLPLAAMDTAVRAGSLPNAGMVVPDLCHDAHDCSLATADAWFRTRMQLVMAGPDWRSGHLAVVLTADEDDHTAGNRVLTVVAHPGLSHKVVHTSLTHYSLTRLYAEVTGAPRLGHAAQAASMATAFGLAVG